jgi:hypothetical protein
MAESTGLGLVNLETNNINEFTDIVTLGTCTIAVNSGAAAHGTYGARFTFDGTYANIRAGKSFTMSGKTVSARTYFKFNSTFAANAGSGYMCAITDSTVGRIAVARFEMNGSTPEISRFYHFTDAGSNYSWVTQSMSVDTLHYIEITYVVASAAGANDGSATLYFDGTSIDSVTGLDNDTIVPAYFYTGFPESTLIPTNGSYVDFDDVKISTAYIGPYAEDFNMLPLFNKKENILLRR